MAGKSDMQALYLTLHYIDQLLVGYAPPDCEIEIDIDGAMAYAKATGKQLCDLTREEKDNYILITRCGIPLEAYE